MYSNKKVQLFHLSVVIITTLLLTGCLAGQEAFNKGNNAFQRRNYDQAVFEYLAAVSKNPDSSEYRMKLTQARGQAALSHKADADKLFERQNYSEAIGEYQLAAELDSSLFSAFEGMNKAQSYLKVQAFVADAENLLQSNQSNKARELVNLALKLIPNYQPALKLKKEIKKSLFALIDGVKLDVFSTHPIDLNFNKTKLPDVFSVLTKLSGINFILDEDIRDKKTTFYLEEATFAQSLELLLRMNKLDKKILNSKTIILYPKTRDKKSSLKIRLFRPFISQILTPKKQSIC